MTAWRALRLTNQCTDDVLDIFLQHIQQLFEHPISQFCPKSTSSDRSLVRKAPGNHRHDETRDQTMSLPRQFSPVYCSLSQAKKKDVSYLAECGVVSMRQLPKKNISQKKLVKPWRTCDSAERRAFLGGRCSPSHRHQVPGSAMQRLLGVT